MQNKLYSAHDRQICPSVLASDRVSGPSAGLTSLVFSVMAISDHCAGLISGQLTAGLVALPVICQNSQCSNNQVKVTDLWSPRRNCWVEVRLWCGAVGVVVLEQKPTTNIWRLSGQVSGLSHFTSQDALHRKLSKNIPETLHRVNNFFE